MAPRLELHDLRKQFGTAEAVRGLSLSLDPGEFVSLLGPSGCGKSTTLAMIAGFETPSAGEVRIDGRVVNDLPPQRRRIGLVFQDFAVFSRMNVRANLAFGLEAHGVGWGDRRRRIGEMAERLRLTAILHKRGAELNMSEMQRVALGRALLTEPELLLLDEPMSSLDAGLRANLRGELKQIQRELGQTVLYVTHDQSEAMSLSDRIAIMRAGEILQIGDPDEIYDRPRNRFVAEFIGDVPINLLDGEVAAEGGLAIAGTVLHRGLVLGAGDVRPGRCLLAIRPTEVAIHDGPVAGSAACALRLVENIGAESVLHLAYGDGLLRAVVSNDRGPFGDTLHVELPSVSVHLIDPDTEAVIALRRAGEAA